LNTTSDDASHTLARHNCRRVFSGQHSYETHASTSENGSGETWMQQKKINLDLIPLDKQALNITYYNNL
jgi:spermidine synthase